MFNYTSPFSSFGGKLNGADAMKFDIEQRWRDFLSYARANATGYNWETINQYQSFYRDMLTNGADIETVWERVEDDTRKEWG